MKWLTYVRQHDDLGVAEVITSVGEGLAVVGSDLELQSAQGLAREFIEGYYERYNMRDITYLSELADPFEAEVCEIDIFDLRDNLDEDKLYDAVWSSPSAFHKSVGENTVCIAVDGFAGTDDDIELYGFLKSKGDIVISCNGESTLPYVLEMLNQNCEVMNGEYIDD